MAEAVQRTRHLVKRGKEVRLLGERPKETVPSSRESRDFGRIQGSARHTQI